MSPDLFTGDLDALQNDELFNEIAQFAEAQPVEGWRHDYTERWDDSALKNVVAFANTFGGVLIVGVRKGAKDVVCELQGVESDSEYKTRIASAIGANISPVPSYDVFECTRPTASNMRFCVVRIRNSRQLYMLTKKGFQPVYVRNEDQTLVANAEQLRSLISRERDAPVLSQNIQQRVLGLRDGMTINRGYQDTESENWYRSPRTPSETFLKLQLIGVDMVPFELDIIHEDNLWKLIATLFPRFYNNVRDGNSMRADEHHADYYDCKTYHKKLDYETSWRITARGDVGFATQMRDHHGPKDCWSVVDLALYIILFLKMSMKWWESLKYFGEGYVYVQLALNGLAVKQHPTIGSYVLAMDPTWTPMPELLRPQFGKDAISLDPNPRNNAGAQIAITYFSATQNLVDIVSSILNQVLRSVGHVVDKRLLKVTLTSMINK